MVEQDPKISKKELFLEEIKKIPDSEIAQPVLEKFTDKETWEFSEDGDRLSGKIISFDKVNPPIIDVVLYNKGKDFDILHFATHGVMDASSPMFSSLIFADKRLNTYEIFGLNLNAYLVCLSACKTGIGEEANGDELVGLSRAFIYAGTSTICSSLWDVSDVATSELMKKFYENLKNNDKGRALKLAQLEIMKKYRHPFFWAPFVLTGDWR